MTHPMCSAPIAQRVVLGDWKEDAPAARGKLTPHTQLDAEVPLREEVREVMRHAHVEAGSEARHQRWAELSLDGDGVALVVDLREGDLHAATVGRVFPAGHLVIGGRSWLSRGAAGTGMMRA